MSRREYYRVPAIGGDNTFANNTERAFRLAGIAREGLLTGIDVIVAGTFTPAAATPTGAQYPGGGIYNLLSKIEVSLTDNAVTPAVQRRVQNETLINIPGYAFGYRGSADETQQKNGLPPDITNQGANSRNRMHRISMLQPSRLLQPGIDFDEVNPNSAAAQKVFAIYRIPFNFANGLRPSDLWLDTDFVRQLEVKLTCGDGNNIIFNAATGATLAGTFAGDIQVIPVNLQSLDYRGQDGSGHLSNGIMRARFDTIPIVSSQAADKRLYNTSANVLYDCLMFQSKGGANAPYDAADGILNELRLQRNEREKIKLPAEQLRALNARQFYAPGAAKIERANDIQHILSNSGLIIVNGFGDDYDMPKELVRTQFQGNADNSSFLELDYTKPANEARIARVIVEFVPNAFVAAMSRPIGDLNSQERAIAGAATEADAQKAEAQRTSRNSGTPTR